MQPSNTPYLADANARLKTLLNAATAALVVVIIFVILLIFVGYGTVRLNVPKGARVTVNGNVVQETKLKLRPGDYKMVVSSPLTSPYQSTLKIGLFRTVNFSPELKQRGASAIASSALGAVGSAGPPGLLAPRWFANNSWVVGVVIPGNADLALRYDSVMAKWVVGYYNGGGYPADLSKLPADVADYIKYLETNYAGG